PLYSYNIQSWAVARTCSEVLPTPVPGGLTLNLVWLSSIPAPGYLSLRISTTVACMRRISSEEITRWPLPICDLARSSSRVFSSTPMRNSASIRALVKSIFVLVICLSQIGSLSFDESLEKRPYPVRPNCSGQPDDPACQYNQPSLCLVGPPGYWVVWPPRHI